MKKLLFNLFYIFVVANAVAQNNCVNNKIMRDYEGNMYETVQIGKQCWMKENMRTLHNAKGNPISLVPRDSMSFKELYAYYPGNDENNVAFYGLLYNWAAAQTICPRGWHLPSKSDYFALDTYLTEKMHLIDETYLYLDRSERYPGYENFTKGKALSDTVGWETSPYYENGDVGYNLQTNNKTNFSARPASNRSWDDDIGTGAYFWMSSYYLTAEHPLYMQIQSDRIGVYIDDFLSAMDGMSVRCIRDDK